MYKKPLPEEAAATAITISPSRYLTVTTGNWTPLPLAEVDVGVLSFSPMTSQRQNFTIEASEAESEQIMNYAFSEYVRTHNTSYGTEIVLFRFTPGGLDITTTLPEEEQILEFIPVALRYKLIASPHN